MRTEDQEKLLNAGFTLIRRVWIIDYLYPALQVKVPDVRKWTELNDGHPFKDADEFNEALNEALKDHKSILL